MSTWNLRGVLAAISALLLCALPVAQGAIVENGAFNESAHSAFAAQISSVDSLQNGSPIVTNVTASHAPNVGNIAALGDGLDSNYQVSGIAYYDSGAEFSNANTLLSNPSITYSLDTVASPGGYALSSVSSFYSWGDHPSFAEQGYTLSVSYVSAPSLFVDLYEVAFASPTIAPETDNGQAASSMVTLTDSSGGALSNGTNAAYNIAALRFTFHQVDMQQGQVITELDAVLTAVPEPSTLSLLGMVACGLAFAGRRCRVFQR